MVLNSHKGGVYMIEILLSALVQSLSDLPDHIEDLVDSAGDFVESIGDSIGNLFQSDSSSDSILQILSGLETPDTSSLTEKALSFCGSSESLEKLQDALHDKELDLENADDKLGMIEGWIENASPDSLTRLMTDHKFAERDYDKIEQQVAELKAKIASMK